VVEKLFFSIVIPTLDEEDFLPLLLKDLAKQSFKNFEVIVIDGNSDDKTVKKAKSLINQIKLVIKVVKKRSVSFQRNRGAQMAKGKWVIFMDADNRIQRNFLKNIKKSIKKYPETDIFSCLINDKAYSDKKYMLIAKSFNSALKLSEKISPQAPGSMIGVRKELTKKFRFDEKKVISEDRFYVDSIVKSGYQYKLFHNPKYKFSMRRFEKERAPLLIKYCYNTLRFHSGLDFRIKDNYYPMRGGKYYKKDGK
jgi:glycosyltransferase involved in cell wall biosynthesis